jgi:hypothetical protein
VKAWEYFCDRAYYDMWAVRPVGSRDFLEPFRVVSEGEARRLADRLNQYEEAIAALMGGQGK